MFCSWRHTYTPRSELWLGSQACLVTRLTQVTSLILLAAQSTAQQTHCRTKQSLNKLNQDFRTIGTSNPEAAELESVLHLRLLSYTAGKTVEDRELLVVWWNDWPSVMPIKLVWMDLNWEMKRQSSVKHIHLLAKYRRRAYSWDSRNKQV